MCLSNEKFSSKQFSRNILVSPKHHSNLSPSILAHLHRFAFAASILCISSLIHAEEFVDNYDLNGDYAKHVYRVDGMRIWNQFEDALMVRHWGPSESRKLGTLVLRYVFDKPIESCSIRANMKAWLDDDEVSLSVSSDDESYVVLTKESLLHETTPPYRQRVLDLSPFVRGKKTVYILVQMRGTQLNKHITTPTFLYTAIGNLLVNAPHVFEFRATTK